MAGHQFQSHFEPCPYVPRLHRSIPWVHGTQSSGRWLAGMQSNLELEQIGRWHQDLQPNDLHLELLVIIHTTQPFLT